MGLLKRARSFQGASRAGRIGSKGLLQKSLEIINRVALYLSQDELDVPASSGLVAFPETADAKTPESVPRTWQESGQTAPEAVEEPDEASLRLRLSEQLAQIEEGIEAPSRLFRLLVQLLRLNRAALLLYDPVHMVFAPWSVQGFDETTAHRLRIPLGANDTMNRLAAGKIFLLSDSETLQMFQPYFSFREFSTLSYLVLIPFVRENRYMGLLLIADTDMPLEADKLKIFEYLAVHAAGVIYNARERHLEGARRGTPEKPESVRDRIRDFLRPYLEEGISPVMIRIDTDRLIESVKQQNPYVDIFRLGQDISRVVLSLFHSLGPVLNIEQNRILILVAGKESASEADPRLLLYHLKATLARLLPELSDRSSIDLNEQVRVPQADLEEVFTLLAEIV